MAGNSAPLWSTKLWDLPFVDLKKIARKVGVSYLQQYSARDRELLIQAIVGLTDSDPTSPDWSRSR